LLDEAIYQRQVQFVCYLLYNAGLLLRDAVTAR